MRYAAKRAAALLFTMGIVSFLTFAAFSAIAGNPAQILLGTQATPERVAAGCTGPCSSGTGSG